MDYFALSKWYVVFYVLFCRIVATSQMQATYARKTFPCFDEPAMKAVFNVTIIHSRDTTALSNGKETGQFESEKNNNGLSTEH